MLVQRLASSQRTRYLLIVAHLGSRIIASHDMFVGTLVCAMCVLFFLCCFVRFRLFVANPFLAQFVQ